MYVLACNRTGVDRVMDCNHAESFIINPQGQAIKQVSSLEDIIINCELLISDETTGKKPQNFLDFRRPQCYGNITLDPYTYINQELLLDLPHNAYFAAATLQFRSKFPDSAANASNINIQNMLRLIDDAVFKAAEQGQKIDLAVYPELSTSGPIFSSQEAERLSDTIPGAITDIFVEKAKEKDVFVVLGMAERDEMDGCAFYNSSVLVGPDGIAGKYRKVHLSLFERNWAIPGDGGFAAFDLPFARIGMLIGCDLMFPESSDSLAKLGCDMLCVPALWENAGNKFIWEARLAEQMHLVIANQWGNFKGLKALGESLLCNYSRYPEKISRFWSPSEGDAINFMNFGTKDSREKRFLENVDYEALLDLRS